MGPLFGRAEVDPSQESSVGFCFWKSLFPSHETRKVDDYGIIPPHYYYSCAHFT
jgi:hypothetical protein